MGTPPSQSCHASVEACCPCQVLADKQLDSTLLLAAIPSLPWTVRCMYQRSPLMATEMKLLQS